MQIKYIFSIIGGLWALSLGGFFAVTSLSGGTVTVKPGNAQIELTEQESPATEENPPAQAFLVQNLEEEHDFILAAYQDEAYREGAEAFFRELTGSEEVAKAVLSNAAAFDIPPALAFALCEEESRFNPRAFNRNRNDTVDRGLFQLNNATFPELKVDDFYDPGINAKHGLSHLRWCFNTAGTEVSALAMYNAGSVRVRSIGTPKNTLDYISRILNRQRQIEGLFIAEYARITSQTENLSSSGKAPFRLSLLMPLGR